MEYNAEKRFDKTLAKSISSCYNPLRKNSKGESVSMNEESYLHLVKEILKQKIREIDDKLAGTDQDLASMHDYFWENYTEFDEYGYEMYDNGSALKSRIKEQEDYKKERRRYERMLLSPYFGRVDFCYAGEDISETYYIGIGNLAESRETSKS